MQLQLIRSATLRLEYAGHRFLIDPAFSPKHTRPSYAGKSPNPLVDLPMAPAEVLMGMERLFLSHLHSDHFDPAAEAQVSKSMPVFCQPCDREALLSKGFRDVAAIEDTTTWDGIAIRRIDCQHGSGDVLADMGTASGFVFRAEGEPTVYWAGDTIWFETVEETLRRERPDVVVVHAAGAVWGKGTLIVMDAEQVLQVCRAVPQATVVATHLESYDHGTVTRASLRAHTEREGVPAARLLIPVDGETLSLQRRPA